MNVKRYKVSRNDYGTSEKMTQKRESRWRTIIRAIHGQMEKIPTASDFLLNTQTKIIKAKFWSHENMELTLISDKLSRDVIMKSER